MTSDIISVVFVTDVVITSVIITRVILTIFIMTEVNLIKTLQSENIHLNLMLPVPR